MSVAANKTCFYTVLLLIFFFASCTDNKTSKDEQSEKKIIDSTYHTKTSKNHIQGQAGKIFVDDGGQAGLPVVLVHSFGGNSTHWEEQLEELRETRRTVAFDLRGHGDSDTPANNQYYVQSFSSDIGAVADSLKLKRFVLVGHSMGGSAAIDYAVRYPERVAGLMLVNTPGKTPAKQSKPIIASLESDNYEQVMEDYLKKLLTNARPGVEAKVRAGMKKLSKPASVSFIKAVFEFDPVPALSGYPGPKLIVSTAGEDQPNALYKQLPEVPHKAIEGTSHWIYMDKPREFNKTLKEFLQSIDQSKE